MQGESQRRSEVRGAGENRNCKASLEESSLAPSCSLCCQLPAQVVKKQRQRKAQYRRATAPSQHPGPPWGQEHLPTSLWSTAALHVDTALPADGRPPVLSFLQHRSLEAPHQHIPPSSSSSLNLAGDVTPTAIHLLPTDPAGVLP